MREALMALGQRIEEIRSQLDLDIESDSYWVSVQVDALADCLIVLCQLLEQQAAMERKGQ